MGFLDHSTNNIILDAVLTDTGRQFLSRNDGSFSMRKFALGDDEVNYGIIAKYGRTVGKEKIEKNTPIFEALTLQSQAQKYKLVAVSNPNFVKIPLYLLTGDSTLSADTFTVYPQSTIGLPVTAKITITQQILNETSIDIEWRDETFIIDLPNLLLRMVGNLSPNNIDRMQRATYVMPKTSITSAGGSVLEFTVACKSLTSTMFDVYGTGTARNTIKTYIRVTGMNSGTTRDVAVDIKQPANYTQCD
jgi:hypothetical protein